MNLFLAELGENHPENYIILRICRSLSDFTECQVHYFTQPWRGGAEELIRIRRPTLSKVRLGAKHAEDKVSIVAHGQ